MKRSNVIILALGMTMLCACDSGVESTENNTEPEIVSDVISKAKSEFENERKDIDYNTQALDNQDNTIDLSSDDLYAKVSLNELLMAKPVAYDRYSVDGYVFEWLESEYVDIDNIGYEDGVLLISRENDADNVQILHVKGEGAGGTMVDTNERFLYADANFDGKKDILVSNGRHGAQGAMGYYCFLKTGKDFKEAVEFADIPNPELDEENKVIHSGNRESAVEYTEKDYIYKKGKFIEK